MDPISKRTMYDETADNLLLFLAILHLDLPWDRPTLLSHLQEHFATEEILVATLTQALQAQQA